MKYNLSEIMHHAWRMFRKLEISFSEALHRAWQTAKAKPVNQKRIEEAKTAAGITEDTDTWNGWKLRGFEVIHGSKCLFQTELIQASKGDDAKPYKASFFAFSQVQPIQA